MKVLVCGGRDYNDVDRMHRFLDGLHNQFVFEEVITGGAMGADWHAWHWAKEMNIPRRVFGADWKKYGKTAGPIRNQRMLDEGKPDLVIAFPGGKGTEDMLRRTKQAGISYVEVLPTSEDHPRDDGANPE
jgi:hypothetical protein